MLTEYNWRYTICTFLSPPLGVCCMLSLEPHLLATLLRSILCVAIFTWKRKQGQNRWTTTNSIELLLEWEETKQDRNSKTNCFSLFYISGCYNLYQSTSCQNSRPKEGWGVEKFESGIFSSIFEDHRQNWDRWGPKIIDKQMFCSVAEGSPASRVD